MPVTTISCSSVESLWGAVAVVAASAVATLLLSTANAGKFQPSAAAAASRPERRRIVDIASPYF